VPTVLALQFSIAGKQFVQAFKKGWKKSLSGFEKFNKRRLRPNQTNGETSDKKRAK
jgi:hypothetical protein